MFGSVVCESYGETHRPERSIHLPKSFMNYLACKVTVDGGFVIARGCRSESGSTNWPLAMTNLPNYTTKKFQGNRTTGILCNPLNKTHATNGPLVWGANH